MHDIDEKYRGFLLYFADHSNFKCLVKCYASTLMKFTDYFHINEIYYITDLLMSEISFCQLFFSYVCHKGF